MAGQMGESATIVPQRAWGRGRLTAKPAGGRTRLDTFYQEGCAKIRVPESFDGRMEAILINSSGGLTGGDDLAWRFEAKAGTDLTLTTQACERIYRASGGVAEVETKITVGEGARLAWLPQETILFDGSTLSRRLEVDLAADAAFLAVEAVLLGRKAMGEAMRRGLFMDRWRIRRAGHLLHAENLKFDGDITALTGQPAVLGGNVAFATLLYVGADAEAQVERLRALLGPALGGVSLIRSAAGEKLVARLVAADGFALRKILVPVISHLRKDAPVPKVWSL
ncbi:urease accessory protein [Rhizobium sp. RU20A]|nr:urease accessory protein [Rhizobium sp. RU20A]